MKIAILGAGKLGVTVLEALLNGDYEVTLVDNNEDRLVLLSQQYNVTTILGDARRIDVLQAIGIQNYDFMLACTSSDDANVIAASNSKALGCKKVVARLMEPEYIGQNDFMCEHYNIDNIINPDLLITSEIYRYLVEKYSLSNGVYTNKRIAMIEMYAEREPRIIDKPLTEFRKLMPGMLVVGISRHGKLMIPHGNDIIKDGDLLFLVGEKKAMIDLSKTFKKLRGKHETQKVMIVGGGRTGFYLSQKLADYGASVKLIESNPKRCKYLNDHLNNVMILQGNGTDLAFLEEENYEQMDAFITATGFDEENLLLALSAKNRGIEDVISKVSHDNYDELISKLGIDIVLNPMDISASTILRIISGDKRVLSSALMQGQAELLEIYVDDSMSILNIPIKKLDLPDYMIIAAINRGSETIIPSGDDVILPGDHLIMVCLLSHIGYIEKLIKPSHKTGFFRK